MELINQQQSRRILIADDDPVIRRQLASIVMKEGYEPVVVDDGREAFRILQADANFSAGVFDMMMPHLEGMDLIRYMRTEKRLLKIPVMMISAESDLRLMGKSFVAGATVYLSKPFNPDRFQTMLRVLLASHVAPSSTSQ